MALRNFDLERAAGMKSAVAAVRAFDCNDEFRQIVQASAQTAELSKIYLRTSVVMHCISGRVLVTVTVMLRGRPYLRISSHFWLDMPDLKTPIDVPAASLDDYGLTKDKYLIIILRLAYEDDTLRGYLDSHQIALAQASYT